MPPSDGFVLTFLYPTQALPWMMAVEAAIQAERDVPVAAAPGSTSPTLRSQHPSKKLFRPAGTTSRSLDAPPGKWPLSVGPGAVTARTAPLRAA